MRIAVFGAAGHDVLALDLAELNLLEEGALERLYDDEKRFDLSKTRVISRQPIQPWQGALRYYLHEEKFIGGRP